MEKINVECTSMVKLNFNGKLTENIKEISRYVADFYENLYSDDNKLSNAVTLLHGDPGTRRRGYKQTRVFNSEQMEETQEHRSGHLYTSVGINNNPQETWGRTDYI